MIFRKASAKDLIKFDQIINRVLEKGKGTGLNWTSNYPKVEHFEKDFKNGHLFILEEDEIIGVCVLNDEEDINYKKVKWDNYKKAIVIHRLMIDGKYSGKGYGRKMLLEIEKFAIEKGYDSIKLDTNSNNKIAQKLYFGSNYKKKGIINLEGKLGEFIALQKSLKNRII